MSRALGVSHEAYESKFELRIIMLCSMAGTLMQALDRRSPMSRCPICRAPGRLARPDTWVLTSYIVSAAIMTAPVGWIASRFGRKNFVHRQPRRLHRHLDDVRRRPDRSTR